MSDIEKDSEIFEIVQLIRGTTLPQDHSNRENAATVFDFFIQTVLDEIEPTLVENGLTGLDKKILLFILESDFRLAIDRQIAELVYEDTLSNQYRIKPYYRAYKHLYAKIAPSYIPYLLDIDHAETLYLDILNQMMAGGRDIPIRLGPYLAGAVYQRDRPWAQQYLDPTVPDKNLCSNPTLFRIVLEKLGIID